MDKEDVNALLKLASRARFCESACNKIRGFVADLELYLRMCARLVQHWGYFLMDSLGAEEAEKVGRSHLADVIVDYAKFKSGVEALFGKFEFEGSFRAQLRTHAQSGAETIGAYAARTTDVCSKAYPAFATETAFARCGPLYRGAGQHHNARLFAARPRVPLAFLARSRADGASMRSVAPFTARTRGRRCNYKSEGRRARKPLRVRVCTMT